MAAGVLAAPNSSLAGVGGGCLAAFALLGAFLSLGASLLRYLGRISAAAEAGTVSPLRGENGR